MCGTVVLIVARFQLDDMSVFYGITWNLCVDMTGIDRVFL